jgi:hypothetical protein
MSANEQTLLSDLMGRGQQSQDFINRTLSGEFLDQGNPFMQQAISAAQRPTMQNLEETLSRALPGLFTRGGQMIQWNPETGEGGSSAFQRAAAIASRGAADAMGDIATKMSYQGYDAERNRQNEAVGMDQTQTKVMMDTLNAQALPRLIEQMGIENGMKEYQDRINSVLQVLQSAAQMTQPTIGQQATSTSTGQGTSAQQSQQTAFNQGQQGSQQTSQQQAQSQQNAQSFNQGEQASQGDSSSKSKSKGTGTSTSTSESSNGIVPALLPKGLQGG